MKIALLVPSRERIAKKKELINSVLSTVLDINNVKIYFGIDLDDPTRDEAMRLRNCYSFVEIVDIDNNGKFLGVGKLWNLCAKEAKEEILAMIGDDMVFRTKGWDDIILREFGDYLCPKDNIKMVYCNDGMHGSEISVNLFIHRRYMELNGYLMREEFMVDFIDTWIQQVLSSLGRVKYRGDILIEHKHWSFRKSFKDSVANNLRGNGYPQESQVLWAKLINERRKEAILIGEHIGVTPDFNLIDSVIKG